MNKNYLAGLSTLFTQSSQNLALIEGIMKGQPSPNKSLKRVITLFEKIGKAIECNPNMNEEDVAKIDFEFDPTRLPKTGGIAKTSDKANEVLFKMKKGFSHFKNQYPDDAVVVKTTQFAIGCIEKIIEGTFAEHQEALLNNLKADIQVHATA